MVRIRPPLFKYISIFSGERVMNLMDSCFHSWLRTPEELMSCWELSWGGACWQTSSLKSMLFQAGKGMATHVSGFKFRGCWHAPPSCHQLRYVVVALSSCVHSENKGIARNTFENSISLLLRIALSLWPQFLHLKSKNKNASFDSKSCMKLNGKYFRNCSVPCRCY